MIVSVLYCDPKGPYPALGLDCWDEKRDARTYAGPGPCILHPPCAAWCQLAGVREARYGYPRGEDGGLFETALRQLREYGGVLEHPAYSKAWEKYSLKRPDPRGGWNQDTQSGEWVCQVSQSAYGHRARKRTWLVYSGTRKPFDLDWSEPYVVGSICISGAKNHHSAGGTQERMWTREAKRTPLAFAQELIRLAEWSRGAQ